MEIDNELFLRLVVAIERIADNVEKIADTDPNSEEMNKLMENTINMQIQKHKNERIYWIRNRYNQLKEKQKNDKLTFEEIEEIKNIQQLIENKELNIDNDIFIEDNLNNN